MPRTSPRSTACPDWPTRSWPSPSTPRRSSDGCARCSTRITPTRTASLPPDRPACAGDLLPPAQARSAIAYPRDLVRATSPGPSAPLVPTGRRPGTTWSRARTQLRGGMMRTLISGGTVVTADGSYDADILVDGETIAQIGRNLAAAGVTADETISASGAWVVPGAIDVHTHMELPFGGTFAKDTFETGTRAAAFGGTTSIVDFAVQTRGQSLRDGLDAWHAKAEGNAVADYGFHMIMSDVNDDTRKEMDTLVAEGVPDFKLFTAYPGVFYSDDGAIFRAMQQTAKNGGLIMMHAENGLAIDVIAADTFESGITDPIGHGLARYSVLEGEATNRVIRLAQAAGVPVYIVHLSAKEALDE